MPKCLQKALDEKFAGYDFTDHILQSLYDKCVRENMKALWKNSTEFPQADAYRRMVLDKIKVKQKMRYIERMSGDDWMYWGMDNWRRGWGDDAPDHALSGYDILQNKLKQLDKVRSMLRESMQEIDYTNVKREHIMMETFGINLRRNKPHPKKKGEKAWELTPRILKKRMKKIQMLTLQQG